jgi:hypothetical protein
MAAYAETIPEHDAVVIPILGSESGVGGLGALDHRKGAR